MYVHKLSPVKQAKNNQRVSYFNMILQTADESYRGVSYRAELHEKFATAEKRKSPIKLLNTKQKECRFDPKIQEIEISKYSKVSDTNVDFAHNVLDILPDIAAPILNCC